MLRHTLPKIIKLESDLFTAFGTYVIRNCLIVLSETDTPFDEFNYVFIVPRPRLKWTDAPCYKIISFFPCYNCGRFILC